MDKFGGPGHSLDMSEGVKRIENNTARIIMLPSTDSFPQGITLLPGLTTVPNLYLDELFAREVKIHYKTPPAKDKPKTRFPGREVVEDLKKPVRIVTPDGIRRGPQITIFEPDQVEVADRPDGPELPDSLEMYSDKASLKMIEVTNQRDKLEAWTADRRPEVAGAATTKLRLGA